MELNPSSLILIVDDCMDDRMFMTDGLHNLGLKNVEHVWNGEQAIRFLKQANPLPDLIFLDLGLPLIDGFGVLSFLQDMPAARNIKVCLCSSEEPFWYADQKDKYRLIIKDGLLEFSKQVQEAAQELLSS